MPVLTLFTPAFELVLMGVTGTTHLGSLPDFFSNRLVEIFFLEDCQGGFYMSHPSHPQNEPRTAGHMKLLATRENVARAFTEICEKVLKHATTALLQCGSHSRWKLWPIEQLYSALR